MSRSWLRAMTLPGIALAVVLSTVAAHSTEPSVDAVVVKDERRMVVTKGGIECYVQRVVQVRGQPGNRYAEVCLTQGAFERVENIHGVLLDASGREKRRLRDSDIHVVTWTPPGLLHCDIERRCFDLAADEYPYVLSYDYTTKTSTLLEWPSWDPQEEIPVREASLTMIVDRDVSFHTACRGLPDATISETGGRRMYEWHVGPLPPAEEEDRMPPEDRRQTYVRFAPDDFEVEGVGGRLDSWSDLGRWYERLASDRYELDDADREALQALVKDVPSVRDAVARIYERLQRSSRYVGVELGIGNWRPRPARETLRDGYGDCKDLATLFIAMLSAVDVRAFPVLTLTRDEGVKDSTFVDSRFNHVIALVPLAGDSAWVDCTSKFHRLGDVPESDEGSDVLVVTGGGGVLARIPVSSARDNLVESRLDGKLGSDGTLEMTMRCAATGNVADAWRAELFGRDSTGVRDWAAAIVGTRFPALQLRKVSVAGLTGALARDVDVEVTASVRGFGTLSGSTLTLNPVMLRHARALFDPGPKGRRFPVHFDCAWSEQDSASIRLPSECRVQALPADREATESVGWYRRGFRLGSDGLLRWGREFRLEKGDVPVSDYPAVQRLFLEAGRSDQEAATLTVVAHGRSG